LGVVKSVSVLIGQLLEPERKVALLSPSLIPGQHGTQELSGLRPTGAPEGLGLDGSEYSAINRGDGERSALPELPAIGASPLLPRKEDRSNKKECWNQ
jgi:hypothetical protein